MADVIRFPRRPASVQDLLASVQHLSEAERFDALHRHVAIAMCEANDLAEASTWVTDAILNLKEQSSGRASGGVEVSASALHLILGYVEFLEGQLGIIAPPAGAA